MTQVLVLHEKHGTRIIEVPPGRLNDVLLAVVKQRAARGWWFDLNEQEKEHLDDALRGDAKAARRLFSWREQAEYEGWDLVEVENVL